MSERAFKARLPAGFGGCAGATSVRAQAILNYRGCLIKVLTDLKKGERRFSIDMQVLTDLERVSIRD